MDHIPFVGELSALGASATWAVSSLFFVHLGRHVRPLLLNTFKCWVALVMLGATTFALEGGHWLASFPAGDLLWLSASGLLGLTLADTFFFEALNRLGARRTLLLGVLTAPITALIALPTVHEKPTAIVAVGMLLAVAGVAWVIAERAHTGTELPVTRVGLGFALLAGLGMAAANVTAKLGSTDHSALSIATLRMVSGSVGLLVHLSFSGALRETRVFIRDRSTLSTLLFSTFIGTFLGVWLTSAGVRYAPTGIAATLSSMAPIFVLPLNAVVLKESISIRAVLGAAIAIVGVALIFNGQPG